MQNTAIHRVDVMLSEQDIAQRVAALAARIDRDYAQSAGNVVLVGLLRGCFIFMADLCRQITVPHEVDFMTVSSYGNDTRSSKNLIVGKDLDTDIAGKDILIIEDIIDTGHTLSKVCALLRERQPKSIEVCTLIEKPARKEVDVAVKYIGFSIPDTFIVGYGLDFAQRYRHLPFIGVVSTTERTQ